MKISAVSCILGIINTLAAYSRGVPHIESAVESVYASGTRQHPSLAFQLVETKSRKPQQTAGSPALCGGFWRVARTFPQTVPPKVERRRSSSEWGGHLKQEQLLTGLKCVLLNVCRVSCL